MRMIYIYLFFLTLRFCPYTVHNICERRALYICYIYIFDFCNIFNHNKEMMQIILLLDTSNSQTGLLHTTPIFFSLFFVAEGIYFRFEKRYKRK